MGSRHSKALTRESFVKLCESADSCTFICKEHKKIMNTKIEGTFSASMLAAGNREENQSQERKLCFDHSRIVLSKEEESYINASYIDGFNRPRAYIAGESPNSETSSNFWQMIWDHQSEMIIMLNEPEENGGYFYWSQEKGSSLQFGKLTVQTLIVTTHPSFQITVLVVMHENGDLLYVNHFMYQGWPKYEITPSESAFFDLITMVELYNRLSVTPESLKGYTSPIVIHCSDGLGRAMVFCAINISISRFLQTGHVNLFSTVSKLRKQRFDCLNDATQYCFCYVALYYYFTYISYARE